MEDKGQGEGIEGLGRDRREAEDKRLGEDIVAAVRRGEGEGEDWRSCRGGLIMLKASIFERDEEMVRIRHQ